MSISLFSGHRQEYLQRHPSGNIAVSSADVTLRRQFETWYRCTKDLDFLKVHADRGFLFLLDPELLGAEEGSLMFLNKMYVLLSLLGTAMHIPSKDGRFESIPHSGSRAVMEQAERMYREGILFPFRYSGAGFLEEELIRLRTLKKDVLLFASSDACAESAARISLFKSIEDINRNLRGELKVRLVESDGVSVEYTKSLMPPEELPGAYERLFPIAGRRKSDEFLNTCFEQNFEIIIDTCSILGDGAASFLTHLREFLRANGKKLWVSCSSLQELQRLRSQLRLETLAVLNDMIDEKRLGALGEWEDPSFFDGVLLQKLVMLRERGQNILVLTQDTNLTYDLRSLNLLKTGAENGQKGIIRVKEIDPRGFLVSK